MLNDQSMMGGSPGQPMQPPSPMGEGGMGMDPMMAGQMSPPADPMEAMPLGEEAAPEENEQGWLDFALMQANLAKKLSKTKKGKATLAKMGDEIVRGYSEDEQSREGWMKNNKEWLELALLVRKPKTFPWANASNVKYPLVATAAMQFSARAFPSLVPSDKKVVKAVVPQGHANGPLYDAAKRVSNHMSFQIMHKLPRWEEDMDKLLMTMAVCGICFKKTYFDSTVQENRSYLVYPEDLCVNYYAKDLDSAYRKTEILKYTVNEIKEKVRNDEEFLDVLEDVPAAVVDEENKPPVANKLQQPSADASTPHVFLACHTFWDLDDDGYEEPYVITVHKETGRVVRVVARWDSDGVIRNAEGEIVKIKPVEYFTDFPFIPNPDGSIYALGFGTLLGPLNISVNTLINLLIDSGVINNMQSGFIGKGLRIKMGETALRPGEWKVVNASGDDLSKSIFPMPSKEPSTVLFQLMNLLIQSGNQLASIAEIFVGKMPGQNTPATTTQETVQQSMAVFTAIYKRVYRSLDSEFKKLYRLNSLNPAMVEDEKKLAGLPLQVSDYDFPNWMIVPGADPVGDSSMVRMQKIQQAGSLLQFGHINVGAYTQMTLEALELPDAQNLMQAPPPPQPDPKAAQAQAQMQLAEQKAQLESAAKQQEMELKAKIGQMELQMKAMELQLKEREGQLKLQQKQQESQLNMVDKIEQSRMNSQIRQMDLQTTAMEAEQAIAQRDAEHSQRLSQNDASFKQKQQQTAKSQKQQAKPNGRAKSKKR